jgi:hypothetical protein
MIHAGEGITPTERHANSSARAMLNITRGFNQREALRRSRSTRPS